MVLGGEQPSVEEWQAALESYWPAFVDEYAARMRARLGLVRERPEDAALVRDLLALLQEGRVDYTLCFRALSQWPRESGLTRLRSLFAGAEGIEAWLTRYRRRIEADPEGETQRLDRMGRVNPKYVLRNWVAQEAIAAAEAGDYRLIDGLRVVLSSPCDEHPAMERFAEAPVGEARHLSVSCSS
jgi:uncharacterized protein YdiU (UPF0061 family)